MGMIAVSNYGEILTWKTQSGHDVLHPKGENLAGKSRGGSFLCAPIFGPTPPGVSWKLPQHGLVRTVNDSNEGVCLSSKREEAHHGEWEYEYKFSSQSTNFPWQCRVWLSIVYDSRTETLIQTTRILRQSTCRTRSLMPVSFAFHPYFAVHQGGFEIRQNDCRVFGNDSEIDCSASFPAHDGPMTLATGGCQVIVRASGYYLHGYNLWTDNSQKYVCIEPYGGVPKSYQLKSGDSVQGSCSIIVK